MNTIDLINKLSVKHNITSGRAEMIISIIIEKLSEKLAADDEVLVDNFGTFKLESKEYSATPFMALNHPAQFGKRRVTFKPDKVFSDIINSI